MARGRDITTSTGDRKMQSKLSMARTQRPRSRKVPTVDMFSSSFTISALAYDGFLFCASLASYQVGVISVRDLPRIFFWAAGGYF